MSDYRRIEWAADHGWYGRSDGALKAVPFDSIVVERSELPAVKHIGNEIAVGGIYRTTDKEMVNRSAEDARRVGLALIALAEYLDVDEAQVSALTQVFYRLPNAPSPDDAASFARALLATGRIEVRS